MPSPTNAYAPPRDPGELPPEPSQPTPLADGTIRYRLHAARHRVHAARIFRRQMPMLLVMFGLLALVLSRSAGLASGLVAAVLAVVLVAAMRPQLRRATERAIREFAIELNDRSIRRLHPALPTVYIRRDDVVKLEEGPLGLMVRSREAGENVFVPVSVDGYPQLREQLLTWGAPSPAKTPAAAWLTTGLIIAWLVSALLSFDGARSLVVAVSLSATLVLGPIVVWLVHRNEAMQPQLRRAIYGLLAFGCLRALIMLVSAG